MHLVFKVSNFFVTPANVVRDQRVGMKVFHVLYYAVDTKPVNWYDDMTKWHAGCLTEKETDVLHSIYETSALIYALEIILTDSNTSHD